MKQVIVFLTLFDTISILHAMEGEKIKFPSAAVLKQRLIPYVDNADWLIVSDYVARTKINEKLSNLDLENPLKIVLQVNYSLFDYHMIRYGSANVDAPILRKRPVILLAIFQDFPEVLTKLNELGILHRTFSNFSDFLQAHRNDTNLVYNNKGSN